MFTHSRSSLKNHTRFQTKMGKVYTCFQTKTAQKPDPMGRHIPQTAYKRECSSRAICPAAGKSLTETKCKTIQNFSRISAQS